MACIIVFAVPIAVAVLSNVYNRTTQSTFARHVP